MPHETKQLPERPDATTPDGSEVRLLLSLTGGSAAHFTLAPGQTSVPVRHRTVQEIWFVVNGTGEMWRRDDQGEQTTPLAPGTCLAIPVGITFQFRCTGDHRLEVVGITMPPWPGDGEAMRGEGPWVATVTPGPGLAPA
jgi:mannose-6-phosphate isomerase-like protein (cupin superfamily)